MIYFIFVLFYCILFKILQPKVYILVVQFSILSQKSCLFAVPSHHVPHWAICHTCTCHSLAQAQAVRETACINIEDFEFVFIAYAPIV